VAMRNELADDSIRDRLTELNDEAADDDDSKARPSRMRDRFTECELPGQHAGRGEYCHVDPEQAREIPLNRVDDNTVQAKERTADEHCRPSTTAQSFSYDGVSTDFEACRGDES